MALTRPRAAQIYDIDYKQATRVVTVSNITLAGGAPSLVDGVTLSANDRILVTGQSTASQNGIYYVSTLGTGSNGTWTRSQDTNSTGELLGGTIVMVTEGVVYADTQWKLTTNDPITIGSTALTFVQNYSTNSISAGTSNVTVLSNSSVTISSAGQANVAKFDSATVTFTANLLPTSNVTYSLGNTTNRWKDLWLSNSTLYLGNLTLSADATQLTVNGANVVTAAAGGAISTAGNITGGNILTSGLISATGNVTVGNISATIGAFTTFTSAQGGNVTGTLIATSANAQFINQTNGAGYVTVAGYLSAAGNVTSGNVLTGGLISSTGNITGGNISATNHTGTTVSITGMVTAASTVGGVITGSTVSASGNVTGGNIVATTALTNGNITITGANIVSTGPTLYIDPNGSGSTDGNVIITGNLSVQGNVTYINSNNITTNDLTINVANNAATAAAANGGGIGVGPAGSEYISLTYNSTSNVWVASNGLNVQGIASATGNVTGGNVLTGGLISATGNITGSNIIASGTNKVFGYELTSTQSAGDEGGQINLAVPQANTTLGGSYVTIDIFQNRLRFFEGSASAKGAYIDLTACGNGVSTNLLAGSGGGTPGGANTNVQFNDAGAFGGNTQFTYDKVTNSLTVGNVYTSSNGLGTNLRVGDDAWIGDINTADTIGIKGQQNAANGYIVFGNSDSTGKLGRAGTGPLTYAGSFSITGTVTGASTVGGVMTGTSLSVSGAVTAASTVGGVITGSSASVSGGVTAASVSGGVITGTSTSVSGTQTAASTVGGVITGSSASLTANVTGGNILTTGLISATGNVSGGNVSAATAIFSLGTVGASGNTSGGNLTTSGQVSATGNITGGNAIVSADLYVGPGATTAGFTTNPIIVGRDTGATYVQAAIQNSSGNGSADYTAYANNGTEAAGWVDIGFTGNTFNDSNYTVTGANDGYLFSQGNSSFGGNLVIATGATGTTKDIIFATGGFLTGNIKARLFNSTGQFSVTGNIVGGNISATSHTGTVVSVTGAITGASVVGGVMTGSSLSVSGAVTAASTVGGVITGSSASVSGAVTAASTVGGVITGSSASLTGNVTGGNIITSGSGGNITGANVVSATTISTSQIVNSGANGVGNIGSSTTYFNTVFAKATSAQYADLAEMYSADDNYVPSTVVEFGGNQEITISSLSHSTQVAGIISTNPSYLMNSAQAGEHVLAVALTGRVPCQVVGTIRKGDRLVASHLPGVAMALDMKFYEPGCIIGKALENYDSIATGVIEVAVGRF